MLKGKLNTGGNHSFRNLQKDLAQATSFAPTSPFSATLQILRSVPPCSSGVTVLGAISFFEKKTQPPPPEQKSWAFGHELPAIYLFVRHFRHMVGARQFAIFTNHKHLTFAFRQKARQCSPRQFRYLVFIGQFSTDIQHVSDRNNVVADELSCIEELEVALEFEALAASQESDVKLKKFQQEDSSLQLRRI
ncbi:hypothetical protein JTB14_010418 [Gonioctena quinquepunctata]|nr:hypothetical protein JTB14_010418 [Gonioctena quinquepunctata]